MLTIHPPLSSLPFLGCPYDPSVKTREILDLENNETPSFIPSLFFDPTKKGSCTESIQALFNKIGPTLIPRGDLVLMKQLKIEIQDHIENRLQLFSQQLLMVYGTNIEFGYSSKALHQAGLKNKQITVIPLQEAHSSTLPCLLFNNNGKQYVFGSGSSFYKTQNTTVKVPLGVNQLDSWIDKTTKNFSNKSLRDESLTLVNRTSKLVIDPEKGLLALIDLLSLRLAEFNITHTNQPALILTSNFYMEVITSYKTLLNKDDILMKTLYFERRSTASLDRVFFLRVQKTLHWRLIKEMHTERMQYTLSIVKPLSDTQKIYVKCCLNSFQLRSDLQNYFLKTAQLQLQTDWTNVVQISAKKLKGISPGLSKIITDGMALITKTYQISTIQKAGALFEGMLFQASLTICPTVTDLYTLPGTATRGPSTRTGTKKLAALLLPAVAAPTTLPPLSKQQKIHLNCFLASAHICALLKNYHKNTSKDIVGNDLKNAATMTPSKMTKLSTPLQKIVTECLKIATKKPQKMNNILTHLLH